MWAVALNCMDKACDVLRTDVIIETSYREHPIRAFLQRAHIKKCWLNLFLLWAQRNINGFCKGDILISSIFKVRAYVLDTFENVGLNVWYTLQFIIWKSQPHNSGIMVTSSLCWMQTARHSGAGHRLWSQISWVWISALIPFVNRVASCEGLSPPALQLCFPTCRMRMIIIRVPTSQSCLKFNELKIYKREW